MLRNDRLRNYKLRNERFGSKSQLGMAQSSIAGAVSVLIERDIIEKDASGYNIINPIIKHLFQLNVKN